MPVVTRLYQDDHPLSHRHVLISFSRLPGSHATRETMRGNGNTYRANLWITRKGWWEVAMQVSDKDGRHVVSLLLHVSSDSAVMAAYSLFSPVGSSRVSVSLLLGREVAELQLEIGAIGDSILRIRLPSRRGPLPAQLQTRLTMLDMVMPVTTAVARREAVGQYAARLFLSMPGVWRVDVSDGQASATAAVVIGKPAAG